MLKSLFLITGCVLLERTTIVILHDLPEHDYHKDWWIRGYRHNEGETWKTMNMEFPSAQISPPMSGKSTEGVSVSKLPNQGGYRVAVFFKAGAFFSNRGKIAYNRKT